jgi:hypothetical protein
VTLRLAQSDAVDLVLICQTIPRQEQRALIAAIREHRRLMPILCVIAHNFAFSADDRLSPRALAPASDGGAAAGGGELLQLSTQPCGMNAGPMLLAFYVLWFGVSGMRRARAK